MLVHKEFFCSPHRCDHLGFQVKCVSRTWDLTSRNGDSVGTVGLMGFTGQREEGVPLVSA